MEGIPSYFQTTHAMRSTIMKFAAGMVAIAKAQRSFKRHALVLMERLVGPQMGTATARIILLNATTTVATAVKLRAKMGIIRVEFLDMIARIPIRPRLVSRSAMLSVASKQMDVVRLVRC